MARFVTPVAGQLGMRSRAVQRLALVLGVVALLPSTMAAAYVKTTSNAAASITLPSGLQQTTQVPVKPGVPAGAAKAAEPADAVKAVPYKPSTISWPTGNATVKLSRAAAGSGATSESRTAEPIFAAKPGAERQAGSLPVAFAGDDPSSGAATAASVTFASRQAAQAAGINGVVFTVARADGGAVPSPTQVTLDYSAFAGAYGGGYADRLKLVELPACALTTPQLAVCRVQKPMTYTNNQVIGTLTAKVAVGAGALATQPAASAAAVPKGTAIVLAATSAAAGSVGTYTATSLAPSGSWTGGGSSGAFTYSYPIAVPPSVGGAAPDVTLSYDSGSVDGRTSATNAQASWIGDGWDYNPGYIERSYQPCAQDGIANSSDECWAGNIVTISLNGQDESLVDDSGTWRMQSDDGTEVIPLTGQANGAFAGEGWEIVEPDGTQYYFGANPDSLSGAPAADSTWTMPVYCPKANDGPSGNTCNTNGTSSFESNMAWRWNLDYVVDPYGNLTTYTWTPETNYYKRGYDGGTNAGTNTIYTRGGYLSSIAYGYQVSDAVAGDKPLDTVTFNVAERCVAVASGFSTTNCTYSYLTSNLTKSSVTENWPDVPADQICPTSSGTCTAYSPVFFSTKRLASITTSVLVGSTPQTIDSYALSEYFPAPQAGVSTNPLSSTDVGDGTEAVMWLQSISRSGEDTLGGGTAPAAQTTTFIPDMMPNRVDGTTTGFAALYRPRIDAIVTPSGEQITVSYSTPQCSSSSLPTPDTNTTNCFPQYWSPVAGPLLDWFNTYQVSEVTEHDLVAPSGWSEAQTTQYSYLTAAWHRDDSPITPNSQRTWNQFHGFQTVTTTTGTASAESLPTQTVTTYLQGMNGDYLANGTQRSVCVKDNVGDCVTDVLQLQGQELETDTLDGIGGAVEKRTVNGPWSYTQTADEAQAEVGTTSTAQQPATTLPDLTAEMLASSQTRSYQLWHDDTWKILTEVDGYDSDGRLVTQDAKGDGTAAVPEVCTSTGYAASTSSNPNMLNYPDEVKAVQGSCGTAPTSATAVSDKLLFYDGSTTLGSLAGAGSVTETQQASSYSPGGSPALVTATKAAYDAYGRVTSSTDADNNTTTTSYTAPGVSPDVVTTTNPMGWTSTVTLDPGRGSTLASTDVNGELTSYTYDGLGDVTEVWSPLHSKANNGPADEKYSYSETGGSISVSSTGVITPTGTVSTVSTSTLRENGSYATNIEIYDGLLRPIQVQEPLANGDNDGKLLTDTHYNSLGQTSKASSQYQATGTTDPSTTVDVPVNDTYVPEESETSYDGLGRTVKSETVAFGVNQYATTTSYPGVDQTDVTPPAGGTATSAFTDALGREIASWKYTTAAPTDNAANAVVTNYTYNAAGLQATISDAAGDQWSYTYNLLGQETSSIDPGTGPSSTLYSAGGEIESTTDADGTTLSYSYDALARPTAEYNVTGGLTPGAANQLAAWSYDTLKKGQPTSVTTYTNPAEGADDPANTYVETQLGYTALYQSTGESVAIPSSQGALQGTYQSTDFYTPETSLLTSIRYGADGGLPSEAVNLGRNVAGLLDGFSGVSSYLNLAQYTPLGQIQATNFGPEDLQLNRVETYDQATGRLTTQSDQLQSTITSTLDDTAYTYDQAGQITAESDTQAGVSTPDTQCFTYNNLSELTGAFTSTDAVNSSTGSGSTQIQGIGGCVDTAPVAGKVTGGPAPYWESYSYDTLGDRVQEIDHDTSVTSTANNVTQTLSYSGYNATTGASTEATTPDAVEAVTTTGPAGTTTSNYRYFVNGQVKSRAGQSFTYDPQGQTDSVTNTATDTTSTYTYDASGTLLVQADPAADQTILYLPWGEQLTLDTGNGQVTGDRYYTESPDGLVIVRSSDGTITYEGDTPQGTATLEVNAATLAYTFRYYDPYGNLRGAPPTSWPDQHSYLGKPQDPTTGLDLLGAREYDPATGRFLSVDPQLEVGDQRQMNGYSYGADDPVNGTDPTGQRWLPPAGGCNGPCPLPKWVTDPSHGSGGGGGGKKTDTNSGTDCDNHCDPTKFDQFGLGLVNVQETDPEYQALLDAYIAALATTPYKVSYSSDQYETLLWVNACKNIQNVCGFQPGSLGFAINQQYMSAWVNHAGPTALAFQPLLVHSPVNSRTAIQLAAGIMGTVWAAKGVTTYLPKNPVAPGPKGPDNGSPSQIELPEKGYTLTYTVNDDGTLAGPPPPAGYSDPADAPIPMPYGGPSTNPINEWTIGGLPKTFGGDLLDSVGDILGTNWGADNPMGQ